MDNGRGCKPSQQSVFYEIPAENGDGKTMYTGRSANWNLPPKYCSTPNSSNIFSAKQEFLPQRQNTSQRGTIVPYCNTLLHKKKYWKHFIWCRLHCVVIGALEYWFHPIFSIVVATIAPNFHVFRWGLLGRCQYQRITKLESGSLHNTICTKITYTW